MPPPQMSTEDLLRLAAALRRNVRIKDRRYLFRSYRRCFVGQEAVAWMLASGAASTAGEAVRLGNLMMEMGLFHHVVYEHIFEDDYLFYRFTEDDDNTNTGAPAPAAAAGDGAASPTGAGMAQALPGSLHRIRRSFSAGGLAKTVGPIFVPHKVERGGPAGSPRAAATAAAAGGPPVALVRPLAAADTTPLSPAATAPPGALPASSAARTATTKADSQAAGAAAGAERGSAGNGAAAAVGASPSAAPGGKLLLLPEPRQDRSRQVLTGHLHQLQGRVVHMAQAADAQKAIVDILVAEVSSLRGEVAGLKTRLADTSTQLQAANVALTHGSHQIGGLRLLTLGICACLLQQALMQWLGGGAGSAVVARLLAGNGAAAAASTVFSGGASCWGVALAFALTMLSLAVALPVRQKTAVTAAVAAAAPEAAAGSSGRRLRWSEMGAVAEAARGVEADPAAAEAPAAADGTGSGADEALSDGSTTASPRCSGDLTRGSGANTAAAAAVSAIGRSSGDFVRHCTEVARLLTAPVRLHLPGTHRPHGATATTTTTMASHRRVSGPGDGVSAAKAVPGAHPSLAVAGAAAAAAAAGATVAASVASELSTSPSTELADGGFSFRTAGGSSGGAAAGYGGSVAEGSMAGAPVHVASGGGATPGTAAGAAAAAPLLVPPEPSTPRTVVPRPSDFEGWPDAPVLLAFDTGAVPEHAQGAGASPWSGPRNGGVAEDDSGKGSLTNGVPVRVTTGQHSPATSQYGPAAATGTPDSPQTRLQHSASAPVACGGASGSDGGGVSPSPPLTPAAAAGAGAPRPFPAPTAGLVRLAANGLRPIRVETELFSGELVVWVRGLATSPDHLFAGKKRMSWIAMQGRFKAPLTLESVVTGQEFARPFKRLPAAWFVERVLLSMARQVSPSMRVGPMSAPRLTMPIIAAAQLVNVSKPGCQPSPLDCPEDVRLFCPRLPAGSSDARRRHFSSPRNRAGLRYDTENVWTFHFWQQFVDVASYKLDFGYTYDLVQHLDGQPLQVMVKDEDSGKYLYNVLMWHERLLPSAHAASRNDATARGRRAARVSGGGDSVDGADF